MATLYYRPQTLETIARITLTQYDEMYLNGKPCAVPIEAIIYHTSVESIYRRMKRIRERITSTVFRNGGLHHICKAGSWR